MLAEFGFRQLHLGFAVRIGSLTLAQTERSPPCHPARLFRAGDRASDILGSRAADYSGKRPDSWEQRFDRPVNMAQSLTDGGSGRRPDERAKHSALMAVETVARLEKGLHRGVGQLVGAHLVVVVWRCAKDGPCCSGHDLDDRFHETAHMHRSL